MKVKPNYSIAYLRILATLFVIGLHIFGQGGLLYAVNFRNKALFGLNIIYVIMYSCINIFGIMSGYLLCEKQRTSKKRFFDIIFTTLFYSFIITAIFFSLNLYNVNNLPKSNYNLVQFLVTGTNNLTSKANVLINSMFPLYWYVTAYLFVLLMVPYINKFIHSLDNFQYRRLLILLFLLISIIPTFACYIDIFKLSYGYSPFWLIYCYLIGAYIKIHQDNFKSSIKKYMIILATMVLFSTILNFIAQKISVGYLNASFYSVRFIDYISPFNLIISVLIFLIFLRINFKNSFKNGLIYNISKTTFAVYIIHVHPLVYNYIIKDLCVYLKEYKVILIIAHVIGYIAIIFAICVFIELIRMLLCKIVKKLFKRVKK